MSIPTESMREGADRVVGVALDGDKFFGCEMVNHPTPSGCDRWLVTYSDKRRFDSAEQAIREFKAALH